MKKDITRYIVILLGLVLWVGSAVARHKQPFEEEKKQSRELRSLRLGMSVEEMARLYPYLSLLAEKSAGEVQVYGAEYEPNGFYTHFYVGFYQGKIFGIWLIHREANMERGVGKALFRHKWSSGRPVRDDFKRDGFSDDNKKNKAVKWDDRKTVKAIYKLDPANTGGITGYVIKIVDAKVYKKLKRDLFDLFQKYWWLLEE